MGRNILFFLFLFPVVFGVEAQSKEATLLLNKVWVLKSDEMKGLGTHQSLTENTRLEFSADGTWKSSELIKGDNKGTWSLENNNQTLLMNFREEKISYLILSLNEKSLQLRYKKNAATFMYTWEAK